MNDLEANPYGQIEIPVPETPQNFLSNLKKMERWCLAIQSVDHTGKISKRPANLNSVTLEKGYGDWKTYYKYKDVMEKVETNPSHSAWFRLKPTDDIMGIDLDHPHDSDEAKLLMATYPQFTFVQSPNGRLRGFAKVNKKDLENKFKENGLEFKNFNNKEKKFEMYYRDAWLSVTNKHITGPTDLEYIPVDVIFEMHTRMQNGTKFLKNTTPRPPEDFTTKKPSSEEVQTKFDSLKVSYQFSEKTKNLLTLMVGNSDEIKRLASEKKGSDPSFSELYYGLFSSLSWRCDSIHIAIEVFKLSSLYQTNPDKCDRLLVSSYYQQLFDEIQDEKATGKVEAGAIPVNPSHSVLNRRSSWSDFEKPKPLVHGLFYSVGLHQVSSRPKCGKSKFLQYLMAELSIPHEKRKNPSWFGTKKPQNILWLTREETVANICSVFTANGGDINRLFVYDQTNVVMNNEEDIQELARCCGISFKEIKEAHGKYYIDYAINHNVSLLEYMIKCHNIDIVVVDTLNGHVRGKNLSSNSDTNEIYKRIQIATLELQKCFIMINHETKTVNEDGSPSPLGATSSLGTFRVLANVGYETHGYNELLNKGEQYLVDKVDLHRCLFPCDANDTHPDDMFVYLAKFTGGRNAPLVLGDFKCFPKKSYFRGDDWIIRDLTGEMTNKERFRLWLESLPDKRAPLQDCHEFLEGIINGKRSRVDKFLQHECSDMVEIKLTGKGAAKEVVLRSDYKVPASSNMSSTILPPGPIDMLDFDDDFGNKL